LRDGVAVASKQSGGMAAALRVRVNLNSAFLKEKQ